MYAKIMIAGQMPSALRMNMWPVVNVGKTTRETPMTLNLAVVLNRFPVNQVSTVPTTRTVMEISAEVST